jgi:GNAT superfamily N-acetyltransferase
MKPMVTLSPASASDLDDLVAIRIEAMRASLERVGRFDPERARQRLMNGFDPKCTRHVVADGQRIGFVVVKRDDDAMLLDHLYLRPEMQGRGIGAAILKMIFAEADAANIPLRVTALRDSDANRFYQRHGFVKTHEEQWDIHYIRPSAKKELGTTNKHR